MKQTRHGNGIWWALGILLGLLILFAGFRLISGKSGKIAGRFYYPYLNLEKISGDAVADQSLLLLSRGEMAAKLAAMEKENRSLAVRAAIADQLADENRKLRKLWKLRDTAQWHSISAEIILRDPLSWRTQFVIDRGSEDGIAGGDVVVTVQENGMLLLAGVVHEVDRHTALVYTVYHPKFRFSFRLKNSGGVGFANTGSRPPDAGLIGVEYLSGTGDIAEGEEMLTTGFERHIPQGIRIGTIRALNTVDPLYSVEKRHTGNAAVAASIDQLRIVLILSRQENLIP